MTGFNRWIRVLFTALALSTTLRAADVEEILKNDERKVIPEFPPELAWINTENKKPITVADLKGKVVLLDFWTYGCINCMHIIPDLKKLERKYEKELVVIGVHSAKFDNEKGLENIRNAAMRHGLVHPILNDNHMDVWKAYGINSWPTLVIIDPTGKPVGAVSGEGNYALIDEVIGKTIKFFDEKKAIDRQKVIGKPEEVLGTTLLYPCKITAQAAGDNNPERLFIADTNRHRILVTTLDGKVTEVIGSGVHGYKDGSFKEAQFDNPRGMAVTGNTVYVADTESHTIRKINLETKTVETIAGLGKQEWLRKGGDTKTTGLNSPWDVVLSPDTKTLYIAMAGNHAIWYLDLEKKIVDNLAGTNKESIDNGDFKASSFSQPSGLSLAGDKLYVADAETSAVRELDLKARTVKTIVGTGLFDFGDKDGVGGDALQQHILAILYKDEKLFVADTYNNKIKLLDPKTAKIETFLGDGKPGKDDETPRFYEPSGLALLKDNLYIADTNNHIIRVVDLKTKKVTTLNLQMPK